MPRAAQRNARVQFVGSDTVGAEQMALPGSRSNPDLVDARFLLKPGRKYEDAVKSFQLYDKTRELDPEAREACC